MATVGSVTTIIQEVESISNSVLAEIQALDPALELPVALVSSIEGLANTALNAFSAASGTPITVASAQALEPNPMPPAPTS